MCGIFGAIGFELSGSALRRALWSLSHRGPDDWGLWCSDWSGQRLARLRPDLERRPWGEENGGAALWEPVPVLPVVLGHARLSVLDTSRCGHQPMESKGPVILVFNGEIYNFVQLRDELLGQGLRFRSTGDAEVLLAAYRTWGPEFVSRLNGAFAFAIWDHRSGELVAARDRMGKKPLYLWQDGLDRLAFASEIKAFWASGIAEPRIGPGVAVRYLALGALPAGDRSFFAGVRQLPPASLLRWRPGRAPEIRRYWEPVRTFDCTPSDAPERLRELLAQSVRIRYRSDVPVAVSLSGGIDSGSLLATSVELGEGIGQERVLSFSAVHEREIGDERARIHRILERYPSVEAAFLPTSEGAGYDDFLGFLALHDEPLKSDGIYNQFRFMRALRGAGIKVALSGQGADELFLGYPWYIRPYARWLLRSLRVREVQPWIRELSDREGEGWMRVARGLLAGASPARAEAYKRRQAVRWLLPESWDGLCAAPFRESLRLAASWPDYHAAQIESESLVALLKDEDRNSMANGVETRLPYLDVHLVEWALTLAPGLHLRDGQTKRVIRDAFRDRLPAEVVESKDKHGFYVPFLDRWPEHREHARQLLRAADWLGEWVNREAFSRLEDREEIDAGLRWRAFNLILAEKNARLQAKARGRIPLRTAS